MKLSDIVIVAAVAGALVSPRHRHAHKRLSNGVAERAASYVPAPVETVIVYELNGRLIGENEVRQGIANGTLTWGDDGVLSSSIAVSVAQSTPPPQSTSTQKPKPTSAGGKSSQQQTTSSSAYKTVEPKPAESKPAESEPAESKPAEPKPTPGADYNPVDDNGNCADCGIEFRNNFHPCSEFPTGYGALHLTNEGLGGWTGIQDPKQRTPAGFDDIYTLTKEQCPDGDCCSEGRFCSYACPNPYLKMSFPKMQGETGQSVGGLYCNKNGKLEMADGSLAKTLCGKGSSHFKVKVRNELSKLVSICRTDYPGTESETIPLTVQPGATEELANPDQSSYYFWGNKATSAQYYINKQGVPEGEACTWGTGAQAVGNWAPTNFGTSWDDINMNVGFSGLSQNKPTNPNDKLDFSVTFTGDGVTNPCKFKKSTGEYCNGDACGPDVGCTASIKEGSTLTLVFTDE